MYFVKSSEHQLYYTRKLRYFVQFFDFIPEIRDRRGTLIPPSELKVIAVPKAEYKEYLLAILNSSLFFWFFCVHSDVRNVNRREISLFPCSLDQIDQNIGRQLISVAPRLMGDFRRNAKHLKSHYKDKGELTIESFQPRLSKSIIDEIDWALQKHYALTDEELDFIVNYDIKYRLGSDADEE